MGSTGMDSECKYLFKIILIGDCGVGKTCLMKRYTDETYSFAQSSTIGVDFKIKSTEVDGRRVKLQIWDTAGQERFRAIVTSYYRGAHGIIAVFDMGCRESFNNLTDWINEVRKNAGESIIIILGNKIDEEEKIAVTSEEIAKFLNDNNIDGTAFYKTSAKNNTCVKEGFEYITCKLMEKYDRVGFNTNKKELFKLSGDTSKMTSCCML